MLTIKFYKISDNHKKLTKALGDVIYTRDAEILSSCSIHDPSFVLLYHSALLEANYFKVEQWNAYYFMNEPTVSPGGRCIVSCHLVPAQIHLACGIEIILFVAFCDPLIIRSEFWDGLCLWSDATAGADLSPLTGISRWCCHSPFTVTVDMRRIGDCPLPRQGIRLWDRGQCEHHRKYQSKYYGNSFLHIFIHRLL